MYVVYILECADGSFYTGITTDIERRMKEHNKELPGGAKYTSSRTPVKLVYKEKQKNRSEASKKEAIIKKLTKKQKEILIGNYFETRDAYMDEVIYKGKENCPFCSEILELHNTVLHRTQYWCIIENKYPYFGKEKGLLVFPKKHREFTSELTKAEFADLKEVEKFMKAFYKGEEYFSFIRQSKSNKSVEHLHYHYITGILSARSFDKKNYLLVK